MGSTTCLMLFFLVSRDVHVNELFGGSFSGSRHRDTEYTSCVRIRIYTWVTGRSLAQASQRVPCKNREHKTGEGLCTDKRIEGHDGKQLQERL